MGFALITANQKFFGRRDMQVQPYKMTTLWLKAAAACVFLSAWQFVSCDGNPSSQLPGLPGDTGDFIMVSGECFDAKTGFKTDDTNCPRLQQQVNNDGDKDQPEPVVGLLQTYCEGLYFDRSWGRNVRVWCYPDFPAASCSGRTLFAPGTGQQVYCQ